MCENNYLIVIFLFLFLINLFLLIAVFLILIAFSSKNDVIAMKNRFLRKGISVMGKKNGAPPSPFLVNLKSNTMKNTRCKGNHIYLICKLLAQTNYKKYDNS